MLFSVSETQSWASKTGVGTSDTPTLLEFGSGIGVVCWKLGVKSVEFKVSEVRFFQFRPSSLFEKWREYFDFQTEVSSLRNSFFFSIGNKHFICHIVKTNQNLQTWFIWGVTSVIQKMTCTVQASYKIELIPNTTTTYRQLAISFKRDMLYWTKQSGSSKLNVKKGLSCDICWHALPSSPC